MSKPERLPVEISSLDPRLTPRGFYPDASFDLKAFKEAYPQLEVVRNHLGGISFLGPEARPPLPDVLPDDQAPPSEAT